MKRRNAATVRVVDKGIMVTAECGKRLVSHTTKYCLIRINNPPNAAPLLEGEQRRFMVEEGEIQYFTLFVPFD